MAHSMLRSDLFVLICVVFQSLYSSFALAPPTFRTSSFQSQNSASAASVQEAQSYACYPADRDALLEVAASFLSTQNFSGEPLHWRQEQDCCRWVRVTCGSPFNSTNTTSNISAITKLYSRVVGLSLADFIYDSATLISPVIPLAICELSALISLDLSGNALTGPIPTCFGHSLTSLQTLILSFNYFRSGSLSPLANLSLLTYLDLSENQLNSVDFLIGGNQLRHLDLSINNLNISLNSAVFSSSPLLQYLDLSRNEQITGDILALEHLQHLETLIWRMSVSAHSLGSLFCKLGSLQILHAEINDFSIGGVLDDKLLCEKPLASVSLTFLDLSGQDYTGSFPRWIKHFAGLKFLDLQGNQFEGSIPQEWQALTQLTNLSLSGDSPTSPVSLSQDVQSWLFRLPLTDLSLVSMGLTARDFPCAGFSLLNHTLKFLDLSNNHISPGPTSLLHCLQHNNYSLYSLDLSRNPLALPLQPHMLPMSIQEIDLSYCQLFGSLSSLGTFASASFISLSHNNLTGSIPSDIGNILVSVDSEAGLRLDLSYNKLTGIIPSSIWNLTHRYLALDNNHLHGVITPGQGRKALALSIKNNYLSKASFHNATHLEFLDLSGNQLQGDLEDLLGDNSMMENLLLLWLNDNQLTSSASISSSAIWNVTGSGLRLGLTNNNLHGELLLQNPGLSALEVSIANNYLSKVYFYNVSFLEFLDLSSNQLGGTLESLLGDYSVMGSLVVLRLFSNHLKGSIPSPLGPSAPSLIVMDLSDNKLTGAIPPSLQHLQALQSEIIEQAYYIDTFSHFSENVKNVEFNITDYPFRGLLDLSGNQLNGVIPDSLGALIGLNDLNFSRNQLSGPIPPSLFQLASLESLDLSFNNLQGAIPSEFLNLTSLEVFNVSFNPELSGEIPEGPQLEVASSYLGDHKLCGQAIKKSCGASTPTSQEPKAMQTVGFKERFASFIKGIEEWAAIPGIILGHVVGTGITIWALKRLKFYK